MLLGSTVLRPLDMIAMCPWSVRRGNKLVSMTMFIWVRRQGQPVETGCGTYRLEVAVNDRIQILL